ncbi:hypothetical protein Q9966_007568 [Columba livia]|nr:hypothetical protein Q9966_007568 [Columba livia]
MLVLHSEWEAVQKSCESTSPCQHVARQYLGLPQRSVLSHILRIEREVGSCVNAFPKRFQTVIARGSYMSKPFQRGERGKGNMVHALDSNVTYSWRLYLITSLERLQRLKVIGCVQEYCDFITMAFQKNAVSQEQYYKKKTKKTSFIMFHSQMTSSNNIYRDSE